jgi:hypothetical protein
LLFVTKEKRYRANLPRELRSLSGMSSSTVFEAAAKERVRWWKPESVNREQKKSGPHMDKTYLLDASAVLHFVDDDIGAGRMERRFQEASRHKSRLLMSVLNGGEVFYHDWQLRGEETARRTMASLACLPINYVPVDLP